MTPPPPQVPARAGLVVRHRASGFTGAVTAIEAGHVTLADGPGRSRTFPMAPGTFLVDGRTVTLVKPRSVPADRQARTASGSVASPSHRAQVAKASRVWVEGIHDAELIEKVWGDDLREAAIVVEPLGGIDDLAPQVDTFGPAPHRRLGVLVDHLVPGSKESRIVAEVTDPHVLITGHPYVDVWQGVRPKAVGIAAWPRVPRDRGWKEGVCEAFGVEHPARLWKQILGRVDSYADLEQPLIGAVERLLDFLTDPPGREQDIPS